MGHWQDRIVYTRDFAFTARRLRMANGNIGDVPASSYAEYVPASSEPSGDLTDGESAAALDGEPSSDAQCDAPFADGSRRAVEPAQRCVAVRPALAHRLYSHRLHVRAKAKLQRDRLLSGPMINVFVGESKRHWALHRNLLCHHSELLESELANTSKKHDDKLELPDHDPAGFELLVKWLYQGRLDDVSDFADANQKYDYAVSCHKLYLLCERFDMPQLKNVAIDQYRKGLNEAELVPDADEINDIYRKSPTGSPFRGLMTKIAARQIMDPGSHRDVETYRECFENNPEFAIDLVNAIKQGTGGMLFDDPTDAGNECEYHDHEAGPNCHIKGKGRNKSALKTKTRPNGHASAKLAQFENSVQPLLPHRPPRLIPNPQPPARQARLQDGVSVGPLRRRLTSPASSTVETTTENATAMPLSPKEQRDKFRKITPPETRLPGPVLEETSHPAPGDHPQNSDDGSHPSLDSSISDVSDKGDKASAPSKYVDETSPRRGIWEWARAGTGRFSMIGRIPHPEWKGPGITTAKAANSAVNGALGGQSAEVTHDDFSLPSSISTEAMNGTLSEEEAAAAKLEGLGISNTAVDLSHFAQTKKSSDELVAAASSINGTPSPKTSRSDDTITNGDFASPPATPSPPPRKKGVENGGADATPSPHRIAKYKIALNSSLLSPARTAVL